MPSFTIRPPVPSRGGNINDENSKGIKLIPRHPKLADDANKGCGRTCSCLNNSSSNLSQESLEERRVQLFETLSMIYNCDTGINNHPSDSGSSGSAPRERIEIRNPSTIKVTALPFNMMVLFHSFPEMVMMGLIGVHEDCGTCGSKCACHQSSSSSFNHEQNDDAPKRRKLHGYLPPPSCIEVRTVANQSDMVTKLQMADLEARLKAIVQDHFEEYLKFVTKEREEEDDGVENSDSDEEDKPSSSSTISNNNQDLDIDVLLEKEESLLSSLIKEVRMEGEEIRGDFGLGWWDAEEGDDVDWRDGVEKFGMGLPDTNEEGAFRNVFRQSLVSKYLGRLTPEAIVAQINSERPSAYSYYDGSNSQLDCQLLHSEVVINPMLLARFEKKQKQLGQRVGAAVQGEPGSGGGSRRATKDTRSDQMSKMEIVYHGTLRQNVEKICELGFLLPGQKVPDRKGKVSHGGPVHEIRYGSTWGAGIYTSPQPSYCVPYTDKTPKGCKINGKRVLPGHKLIVCAALMGRRYYLGSNQYHRRDSNPVNSYDSHISPSRLEWVAFDSAQLLPIMVLHLEWVSSGGSKYAAGGTGGGGGSLTTAGRIETEGLGWRARQKLLTVHARKHFPQGFGPAGDKFVVEEIGEVDEDEELWGDYQDYLNSSNDEFQNGIW